MMRSRLGAIALLIFVTAIAVLASISGSDRFKYLNLFQIENWSFSKKLLS